MGSRDLKGRTLAPHRCAIVERKAMQVSQLKIEKFRGIRSGTIRFRQHTVLIGANNCGKTTILDALTLVVGQERLVRSLTEHDFYGSAPQSADRIRISAMVTGFNPDDPRSHPDWFRDGRAVPKWFDQLSGNILPERTDDSQFLACQIGFAARFDGESLDVETVRYFVDDEPFDAFEEETAVSVPTKLIREVGFFLIPAHRTWDRLLSFGSDLFRRVVRSTDAMPADTVLAERDRLRNPPNRLEEDQQIQPVIKGVNSAVQELLGIDSSLRLRLTATDSSSVLDAIVPHFKTATSNSVPSKRVGSGMMSLQSLFLLLHLSQKRIDQGQSVCMALEEPELHLPPAAQRRVLSQLQSLSTQTIVTTHSPLVAGYCDPSDLLIVRNDSQDLTASPVLEVPLTQTSPNAVRKLFQINRTEVFAALMCEAVLVPEGRYDFDWLTLILRAIEMADGGHGPSSFGVRVGVVPTSDAKVVVTCETLSAAHPCVCALVDGDDAGKEYASGLAGPESGAQRVLLWPDQWTIEDIVGWIVEADEELLMQRLTSDLAGGPGSSELVGRLKSENRKQGGMKGDIVAYEIIANALADHRLCVRRARNLLDAIASACVGEPTKSFQQSVDQGIPKLVFKP